ncbi:MATE family efflux transporter [Kitasatospora sp. NPDC056731]|uniref:MATE family efflux transporter n=1 Tax=Kitasatospora sp. NPDC056731 TaxID=3155422 RepID=UPI0034124469
MSSNTTTTDDQSPAAHTRLTARNFNGYAAVVFMLGTATVGFGAVDLAMIAPKGVDHVAAVGQGDLLILGIYSFFQGAVEAFSSRLSVAEGAERTAQRLPALLAALLTILIISQFLGSAIAYGSETVISWFGQSPDQVPLVGDYVQVRSHAVALVIIYWISNESLKICGARNLTFVVLGLGFVINAALDWLFLYTSWGVDLFATPESAVATSTVAAQVVMAACSAWMFVRLLRKRGIPLAKPERKPVFEELRGMSRLALGVGARNVNDYTGSIVPVMLIGTLGVPVMAASLVATKIYTLFCRVPQACFESSFVHYGYWAGGSAAEGRSAAVRILLRRAAIPTAVATVLTALASPWLVGLFSGEGLDRTLAVVLVLAYLLYVPLYFAEQFLGKLLVVHRLGGVLFAASTAATYLLVIPLAWCSVNLLHSPFAAVACKGIASAALTLVFYRAYRRSSRAITEGTA